MLLPTENLLQFHESADEINHDHREQVMACLSAAGVSPRQYSCIPSPMFPVHTLKQVLG
jgi:dTDP-4-amino-4,6-dideoxygalactose transaminase